MTTQLVRPNKIVLAYSGGLDTSVILKWLQNEYNCEVITYTADLGQNEDLSGIKKKAKKLGIDQVFLFRRIVTLTDPSRCRCHCQYPRLRLRPTAPPCPVRARNAP